MLILLKKICLLKNKVPTSNSQKRAQQAQMHAKLQVFQLTSTPCILYEMQIMRKYFINDEVEHDTKFGFDCTSSFAAVGQEHQHKLQNKIFCPIC